MSQIWLLRIKTERMNTEKFAKIARYLGIDAKPVETDEALAIQDPRQALAYGQPGAKFAGLLFYTDQSKGVASAVEKPLDIQRAKRWADDFLGSFDLLPRKVEDKRIRLAFEINSYQTNAVVFDGKERRKTPIKTEISSKIALNDIPVVGPRAKVRMVFKDREKPVMIHRGLWESIEPFEERELVREHDVVAAVREKLAQRRNGKAYYDVVDIKLAYFAQEFCGGPDLLVPFYFVEVEFVARSDDKTVTQGPRQVLRVPAYR